MAEIIVKPIIWDNEVEKKDYKKSKTKKRKDLKVKEKNKRNKHFSLKNLKSNVIYVQNAKSYYLLEYKFTPKRWIYYNYQKFVFF